MPDRTLTTKEVCAACGVSPRKLMYAVEVLHVVSLKDECDMRGGCWFWPPKAVAKMLKHFNGGKR